MKKSYTLLDTNVIIALLDERDSLHTVAKKLIEKDDLDTYAVLDILLGEVYSVLVRRCKERNYDCLYAVEALEKLEKKLNVVHVYLKQYHRKIVKQLKKNPELNYNDWLLIIYALEKGVNVLTLDKKLNEKLQSLKNQHYDGPIL
jgi:predicted nucleic acid-binding protein